MSGLFRPYPLAFQEIVDQIKECTSNMDAISNSSSHAEIRGITCAIQDHGTRLQESDQKLNDMQQRLVEMQAVGLRYEAMIKRLVQVAESKSVISYMGFVH
jgi:DNA repair ATPase RecN